MFTALGYIATQQVNPTEDMIKKVQLFLDYSVTHPDSIVTFRASDMILAVYSDASYLL